jgi:hypothetical protein
MHKKDVPQDSGVYGPLDITVYATDDDGKFVAIPSLGWDACNRAAVQAAQETRSKIYSAMEAVKQGRLSPLGVHMIAHELTPAGLSKISGVNWLKVKLHLRPRFFKRISATDTKRYAEAFGIAPSKLRDFPELAPLPVFIDAEDRKAE